MAGGGQDPISIVVFVVVSWDSLFFCSCFRCLTLTREGGGAWTP